MFNYGRTQTTRRNMAAPMRELRDEGFFDLFKGLEVLHFGEGKDIHTTSALFDAGAKAYVYDPYSPWQRMRSNHYLLMDWDVIISSYVYNVIPANQRTEMFLDNQRICAVQIWSVRADKVKGQPFEDGVITQANTFQKSYSLEEAQNEWPNATVLSYHPARWITLFQPGLLYPRNLSVPIESRVLV